MNRPPQQQQIQVVSDPAKMQPQWTNLAEIGFLPTEFTINFFCDAQGAGQFLRHVVAFLIMRPSQAKQLCELLAKKIEDYERQYPDGMKDPQPSSLYVPEGAGKIVTPN